MDYIPTADNQSKFARRSVFTALYLILFGVFAGVMLMTTVNTFKSEPSDSAEPGSVPTAVTPPSNGGGVNGPATAAFGFGGDYRSLEEAVIEATRNAMPAVVTIHVTGTVQYRLRDPYLDFFFGPQIRQRNVAAMGSGVIIDPDGTIITNDHVVGSGALPNMKIQVELTDGRTYDAVLKNRFPMQDVAILSIDGGDLPSLPIGSTANVQPGQTVLAIGNPFGNALTGGLLGSEPTVTRGIISAKRRNLTISSGQVTRYYRNMLQTDASINQGNSGGALIDLGGNLIGMNTAIYSPNQAGSVGIGFAIPSDRIRLILDRVKDYGDIGSPYSGVTVQDMTDQIAEAIDYTGTGGVVTVSVDSDSPGEKSGLKRGDIIVRVNGFLVTDAKEIVDLLQGSVPGETFQLSVFRDGKTLEMGIEIGSRD